MKYFDRFAIAGRIYCAAFVLIAALAGVTVAAWVQLNDVVELADRISDNKVPPTQLRTEVDKIKNAATGTRGTLVLLVIALAVGMSGVAWYIGGVLRRRVGVSQRLVERVRDGDLTSVIGDDARDEFSPLLATIGEMQTSLTRVVGHVRWGAESV